MDGMGNVNQMDCAAGAVCTKYTLSQDSEKATVGSCIGSNHCSTTPPVGTMSDCTTCTTDLCNKSSAGRMIPQTTLAVLLAALPLIANLRH